MFIVHGAWFRRNARPLLFVVLLVLIPGFILLYTHTDTSRSGREQKLPKIGGAAVNPSEYEHARAVITGEMMLNSGGQMPRIEHLEETINQDTVLRLLLLRKAREFNILVGNEELVDHIQRLPAFRGQQGGFDPERYRMFVAQLPNSHITESDFEEIIRQQITLQRLQSLITTAAKVTPLEVRNTFNALHERTTIDYVEFAAADYKEPIKLTDDEVKTYFDQNQEHYRVPRQVKVRYVRVPLSEATQKVSDEDIKTFFERSAARFGTNSLDSVKEQIRKELIHSRALAQASDRATELTVKLVPEPGGTRQDFAKVAGDFKLEVKETSFFGPEDKIAGIAAGPAFNQAALGLMKDSPVSDAIEGEDGYYVMELVADKPSAIPQLADVKARVTEDLKQERTLEATVKRGEELAGKLKEAVGKGKTFAAAAGELKLVVKKSEPFNLVEQSPDLPGENHVKNRTLGMRVGEVSEFIRTEKGGVVFAVRDRTEPTNEEFEKQREQTTEGLRRQSQEAVWQAWLQDLWRREQVSL